MTQNQRGGIRRQAPVDYTDAASPPLTATEYRLLVEYSPVMIWRADLSKQCDYFNRTWLDFTGRTLKLELGDGWAEGVHPDDLARCLDVYVSHFDRRQTFEMEYRLRRHDGEYRWIYDRGTPYFDDRGEFAGYIGSCVDVTERREAEHHREELAAETAAIAVLRESEARQRFLGHVTQTITADLDYEHSLDALVGLMVPAVADVCFFDEAMADGSLHRRAWKHADATRSAWLADSVANGIRLSDSGETADALRAGVPEFVALVDDAWIVTTASSPAHAAFLRELDLRSLIRIPIRDADRLVGVLTLARTGDAAPYGAADVNMASGIGDRLTALLRNARLYTALQHAVRTRDEVTSIVSHDLRNPVNAVLLASSLLLEFGDALDASIRRDNLAAIHRSASSMGRLLEDLLQVMRSEASGLVIQAGTIDLGAVIHASLEEFRLQAAERRVALSADIAAQLPPARADASRVGQVLSNLLANALRFTPAGGEVHVEAVAKDGSIMVVVRDSGVGIAPENLPYVFDRFWQARHASRAGAGLGLAIAKGIIEGHSGRIWVESTEGGGTTFRFTLPIDTSA